MKHNMKKHTRRFLSALLVLFALLPLIPFSLPASAQEVESRKTPIMGWASWNAYRTDISEEIILSQAEKLVELGLKDLGYESKHFLLNAKSARSKVLSEPFHPI